jgi:transcriptional antiterminator RfaH
MAANIGEPRRDVLVLRSAEPNRERLALHCLTLNGFVTYLPRLRETRIRHGRKIETCAVLFPGYCFIAVELQWHTARWSPGVAGLLMNGAGPARVPDSVIGEIRGRENAMGLVELPQRDDRLVPGDRVRIVHGPMHGLDGLVAGMRGHERVAVLLGVLRVELPRDHVEAL